MQCRPCRERREALIERSILLARRMVEAPVGPEEFGGVVRAGVDLHGALAQLDGQAACELEDAIDDAVTVAASETYETRRASLFGVGMPATPERLYTTGYVDGFVDGQPPVRLRVADVGGDVRTVAPINAGSLLLTSEQVAALSDADVHRIAAEQARAAASRIERHIAVQLAQWRDDMQASDGG